MCIPLSSLLYTAAGLLLVWLGLGVRYAWREFGPSGINVQGVFAALALIVILFVLAWGLQP